MKTQEIRIDLCNSEGKLVQVMVENKKFLQGQHIEQLNLKNISTGNYLLRLHTKAGILTEKISKI
ncbi:MAG: T9SS type A sorting domain-containing protein [Saprospiraceae bacterium]|nr:T9SS type A sorting domain-containing protein [Saprospiraceae bacterium]